MEVPSRCWFGGLPLKRPVAKQLFYRLRRRLESTRLRANAPSPHSGVLPVLEQLLSILGVSVGHLEYWGRSVRNRVD